MNLFETKPSINIDPGEFKRLLGLPPEYTMAGRVSELAEWAGEWYAANGNPWVYAHQVEELDLDNIEIRIEGESLHSPFLRKRLTQARAHGGIMVAVGAGPEAEMEAARHWREGRPDEYFYLESYGSAVVEHLVMTTGARLCEWADGLGMAVLPHYSPGYQGWDLQDQQTIFRLLQQDDSGNISDRLEILPSGMLRPKKSMLAVFGLTRHTDLTRRLTNLIPCNNCAHASCDYRRAPYQMPERRFKVNTTRPSTESR
jgi:hypothetical protein